MISYKQGVLSELKKKGYTTTRIRNEKLMAERQLQYIRTNNVTIAVINKLCQLLECQPGDILEYVPEEIKSSDNIGGKNE